MSKRQTERSVFKIIFVKLANFRANILETEGDFSWFCARGADIVGKIMQWRSTTQYDVVVVEKATISIHQAKRDLRHVYQMLS